MSIFGTDGIRGRAGEGLLVADTIAGLGTAFVGVLGGSVRLAIARDTRESGGWIRDALVQGMTAAGADVDDLGVLPTPALSWWIAREADLAGGVMITASHNPWPDNGLKLFGPGGGKASDAVQEATEAAWRSGSGPVATPGAVTGSAADAARDSWLASLAGADLGGRTVVFDDAAGAAAGALIHALGGPGPDRIAVAGAPDGRNINDGLGAVHPEAAAARVREHGAWAGIVVDGDGDRIMLIDEQGAVHNGDAILGFLAARMAGAGTLRGGAVVGTVTTNGGLAAFLQERGIDLVRTPVGDRHVAAAMSERGCNLGGESSGHVLTPDLCPSGDGIRVGLLVLREAAQAGRPLSELLGAVPRYPSAKRKVAQGERPPIEALLGGPEVRPVLAAIEAGGGRPLVRYSGTEPYLRIQVEGPDGDLVEAWAERLAGAAGTFLGS